MISQPSNSSEATVSKPPAHRKYLPGYILFITIIGIAVAEIIAMGVIYPYRHLPYYQQVIMDATVMTVIIFPLLYLLSTRPLLQHIQQQACTERILQTRISLNQYANDHTLDELLQEALDKVEALTSSSIGYFHFLESDQTTLWLRAWSTKTLEETSTMPGKDSQYDVNLAGVWADCVRERRPVIHNDYPALPHRNGLPDDHAAVVREMAVPIMREGKIVSILGLGNKTQDYTMADVDLVKTLADFVWDIVRDKQAEQALRDSEEKFRNLADWTYDWEIWLDPQSNIVYNSTSCERITGYTQEEFITTPDLRKRVIHPDEREAFEEHEQRFHSESASVETLEYRVIARDGKEHWVEHVCRPLFAADQHYLGRRISNRDITERKRIAKEIAERNQREKLLTQTLHTIQLDVARDLHDTLGQNISFLRMKLDHLVEKKSFKQAELRNELVTMRRAANESYDLLRGTLAVLQSINSTDLHRLFTRYAAQVEERSAFQVNFSTCGEAKALSAPRIRQLFYIFREILNNIEKHAHASQVTIEMLWAADALSLLVSDNGKGFNVNQISFGGHYGLKFMRERVDLLNGSLTVTSGDSGTNIAVQIPYETSNVYN
jgi:PAS domain S-box-containing protein